MELKISKKKFNLFQKILITVVILLASVVLLTPSITSFLNKENDSIQRADFMGYVDYSSAKSFSNKKNVLFFKANWCSSCSIADDNFLHEIRSIPNYLTIYKVDFEKEVALRQKYGVTVQHTFVEVDNQGNALKKWEGSYTIDEVLSQLV